MLATTHAQSLVAIISSETHLKSCYESHLIQPSHCHERFVPLAPIRAQDWRQCTVEAKSRTIIERASGRQDESEQIRCVSFQGLCRVSFAISEFEYGKAMA